MWRHSELLANWSHVHVLMIDNFVLHVTCYIFELYCLLCTTNVQITRFHQVSLSWLFIFVLISIYISNQLRDAFMPPFCKKTLCVWVLRRILVFVSEKLIVIDWYHLKFFNNEYLLLSIFVKSSSKPYMYSSERVCTLCMIKLIISISLYFFHHGFCSKKNQAILIPCSGE